MEKALEEINKLEASEVFALIFLLLKTKKIDFIDLSNAYVEVLKDSNRNKSLVISGLAIPLISYWQNGKMMKSADHARFIRSKAAYNLLKSKMFHTAPIEKELEAYVDKYGYSEDENGMHKMTNK